MTIFPQDIVVGIEHTLVCITAKGEKLAPLSKNFLDQPEQEIDSHDPKLTPVIIVGDSAAQAFTYNEILTPDFVPELDAWAKTRGSVGTYAGAPVLRLRQMENDLIAVVYVTDRANGLYDAKLWKAFSIPKVISPPQKTPVEHVGPLMGWLRAVIDNAEAKNINRIEVATEHLFSAVPVLLSVPNLGNTALLTLVHYLLVQANTGWTPVYSKNPDNVFDLWKTETITDADVGIV